jgi:hypothetical protein
LAACRLALPSPQAVTSRKRNVKRLMQAPCCMSSSWVQGEKTVYDMLCKKYLMTTANCKQGFRTHLNAEQEKCIQLGWFETCLIQLATNFSSTSWHSSQVGRTSSCAIVEVLMQLMGTWHARIHKRKSANSLPFRGQKASRWFHTDIFMPK